MSSLSALSTQAFELTETWHDWLIEKPLQVLGYVALAIVLKVVLHRSIERMTVRTTTDASGRRPMLLRHLRERVPLSIRGARLSQRRAQRAHTIGSVLKSTVSVVVLTWCVLQVLAVLGVNVAPFIASAGIIGVALGFGAQNLVRDFLSGIFMLLEDQYGVGDIVDLGEASGTVESVGLRVTTVRDANGTVWYVRNGEVLRVGNKSQGYAVAVLDLPISHNSNVDEALAVARQTALAAVTDTELKDDVLEPPEMLGVEFVSADTITLRLTVKVRPARQWAVQRALHQGILEAFEARGIQAPYPHGRPGGPVAPALA